MPVPADGRTDAQCVSAVGADANAVELKDSIKAHLIGHASVQEITKARKRSTDKVALPDSGRKWLAQYHAQDVARLCEVMSDPDATQWKSVACDGSSATAVTSGRR